MRRTLFLLLATAGAALVLVSAGRQPAAIGDQTPAISGTTEKAVETPGAPLTLRQVGPDGELQPADAGIAPLYNLNRWSVNGGGATSVTSTSYKLGLSAGQSVAGFANGANYDLGIGFWYGAASASCPIAVAGDVNVTGTITSADIITLVNYVFKGGAAPLPCAANGDVNCTGSVTSADIISMVNFVFKGGAAPCNICALIPGTWSCP